MVEYHDCTILYIMINDCMTPPLHTEGETATNIITEFYCKCITNGNYMAHHCAQCANNQSSSKEWDNELVPRFVTYRILNKTQRTTDMTSDEISGETHTLKSQQLACKKTRAKNKI